MTPNAKRVAAYQKRQSEKVARMKAALGPFALMGEMIELETTGFSDTDELELLLESGHLMGRFRVGDFRLARQALAPTDGRGEG